MPPRLPALVGGGLSRGVLDRAAELRGDDSWWQSVLADPATLAVAVSRSRVALEADPVAGRKPPAAAGQDTGPSTGDDTGTGNGSDDDTGDDSGDRPRLAWRPLDQAPPGHRYLLGLDPQGRARVAVHVAEPGPGWVSLREVGDALDDLDAGAATHAVALANWHDSHPFSARDGGPTRAAKGGAVRVDHAGQEFYPRTDAAMIVLVRDRDDRALLGHQAVWPAGRYSCLAGFVEAGESLEQAVVREVREEAGIDVDEVVYAGSQPWPFPRSLMVGFFATAVGGVATPDGEEITDLRWYARDELRRAVDSRELLLPGRVSIARRLVETWYGGALPYDW